MSTTQSTVQPTLAELCKDIKICLERLEAKPNEDNELFRMARDRCNTLTTTVAYTLRTLQCSPALEIVARTLEVDVEQALASLKSNDEANSKVLVFAVIGSCVEACNSHEKNNEI